MLEVAYVPCLPRGQYPGLYLFSTPSRMMRPVINLATNTQELIGSFEQVMPTLISLFFCCFYKVW